jgi:hypothetical protein
MVPSIVAGLGSPDDTRRVPFLVAHSIATGSRDDVTLQSAGGGLGTTGTMTIDFTSNDDQTPTSSASASPASASRSGSGSKT